MLGHRRGFLGVRTLCPSLVPAGSVTRVLPVEQMRRNPQPPMDFHGSRGKNANVKISTGSFPACKFIIRLLQPAPGTRFCRQQQPGKFSRSPNGTLRSGAFVFPTSISCIWGTPGSPPVLHPLAKKLNKSPSKPNFSLASPRGDGSSLWGFWEG